jgi:hypothetical protein
LPFATAAAAHQGDSRRTTAKAARKNAPLINWLHLQTKIETR